MKIIISRKGFDSSAGGRPSPILPDGSLFSLPIPDPAAPYRYDQVQARGRNLGDLVYQLTNGKITHQDRVHLDPDLEAAAIPRLPDWRPLFGQTGAAQGHLLKMGVTPGDLFLYYGWFRQTREVNGSLQYVKDAPHLHLFFGWFQIHRIVDLNRAKPKPWMADHPHCFGDRGAHNVIYTARERLSLPGRRPRMNGAGVFPRKLPELQLTQPGENRSIWKLPYWFHPENRASCLSYHQDPKRWTRSQDGVRLKNVYRGQDFVLDADHYPEALDWALNLIRQGSDG